MKTLLTTAGAAIALTGVAQAAPVVIDFEDQAPGTTITTQYAGVTVSATQFGAMVFDTDDFTGGDDDLAAPFTDANGATLSPGNVLIVSEDGDASDPDDNARGGTITFDFDQAVTFEGFNVFDIDRAEDFTATFFDDAGMVVAMLTNTQAIGNNGFQAFSDLGIMGVLRAEFSFTSSGAIDDFAFDATPVPVPAAGLFFLTGAAGLFARRKLTRSQDAS
jgi:hypothetical protein